MKFGKTLEREQVGIDLPSFPYKSAKKIIKTLSQTLGHNDENDNPRDAFLSFLDKEVRRIDLAWKRRAQNCVLAAKSPRQHRLLSSVGLRTRPDPDEAKRLEQWAQLSREGVRKILKKYNKRLGSQCGPIDALPGDPLDFAQSRTRTELECLTKRGDDGQQSGAGSAECAICLDILFDPVAPACGHAVCRTCYQGTLNSAGAPKCAVCRRPASSPRRMPMVGEAARRADPEAHAARKLEKQREQDEALAKKFERRVRQHPMNSVFIM